MAARVLTGNAQAQTPALIIKSIILEIASDRPFPGRIACEQGCILTYGIVTPCRSCQPLSLFLHPLLPMTLPCQAVVGMNASSSDGQSAGKGQINVSSIDMDSLTISTRILVLADRSFLIGSTIHARIELPQSTFFSSVGLQRLMRKRPDALFRESPFQWAFIHTLRSRGQIARPSIQVFLLILVLAHGSTIAG